MPRFVAFLRAINVGGRRLKMETLRESVADLGFDDVSTFIASGNVVFRSAVRSPDKLATKIEAEIEAKIGFFAETFVRSVDELRELTTSLESKPNRQIVETNVGFLKTPLNAKQLAALDALESAVDAFEVRNLELVWRCRVKQSESKFTNAVCERKLGLKTTFRRVDMLRRLIDSISLA